MSATYSMRKLIGISSQNEKIYPQMKRKGLFSTKEIAQTITQISTFTESDVIGVLDAVSHLIAKRMADGYSVKIDNIGIFSASLGITPGRPQKTSQLSSLNIQINGINFRSSPELIGATNDSLQLQHSKEDFASSSTEFTKEQRLNMAQQFLENHERMTVSDYAKLTGLVHGTAAHELQFFTSKQENGICPVGHGPTKYYTRNQL